MTSELKTQFVAFVIAALCAAGDVGMIESALVRDARLEVHPSITGPELSAVLRELADKGLVISWVPALGAHRWRITALGRSVAAEQFLA